MNNQGLLALAQLILPSEILTNFEVVRVEEEASLIRIYLDESVKAEYKESPEIESKGFCEAVTIRDFPIRDKGVDLIVRRRKWYDKQNNQYFSDSYELKAEAVFQFPPTDKENQCFYCCQIKLPVQFYCSISINRRNIFKIFHNDYYL